MDRIKNFNEIKYLKVLTYVIYIEILLAWINKIEA